MNFMGPSTTTTPTHNPQPQTTANYPISVGKKKKQTKAVSAFHILSEMYTTLKYQITQDNLILLLGS